MTVLQNPANDSVETLHTAQQIDFYNRNRECEQTADFEWANLHQEGDDCSAPRKIRFSWSTEEKVSVLELSETADFRDALKVEVSGEHTYLDNLKIGQTYFWRVNGSEPWCFTTEDLAPRWIAVDGLANIRDNGGWKTQDGRRMKQGLIYRGCEMEWLSYHDRIVYAPIHPVVTEAGKKVMLEDLGIKTDLDLRIAAQGYLEKSPLGESVKFRLIPVSPYHNFLSDENKPAVKRIFELLADENAYPIYYHCWGGIDRTGTIAFLLEAYLGVSWEDMILDYEISSIACWGKRTRNSSNFTKFQQALAQYDPEGSLQSRTEKFLLSCGISRDTLQRLRDNLLCEQ